MNPHAFISDPKQIEAIESIRRLDEKGHLYHMNCEYDYYDLPAAFKAVISAGCSVFVSRNEEGDVLYCRNYDFSHYPDNDRSKERTGINVVVETDNPKAKYRSIGVADAYWIDHRNGSYYEGVADDGKSDLSSFVLCPFLCMDGMNEKGLAVSILALVVKADWQEIPYDTYKEGNKEILFLNESGEVPDPYYLYSTVDMIAVNEKDQKAWICKKELIETHKKDKPVYLHPILMRLVLDNCASVEEALRFMDDANVKAAMPGADYHIMVADASGRSTLVEWDGDEMKTTDIDHATNHYVCKEDHFFPDGCGRDKVLEAELFRIRKAGYIREDYLLSLLNLVIQDPGNGIDRSKTQYSCIYNLNKKTVRIYSFGDLSKHYDFALQ